MRLGQVKDLGEVVRAWCRSGCGGNAGDLARLWTAGSSRVAIRNREIKGMRTLQEGRHSVARHLFHGRNGELYQAYIQGMEDQLGALGLVLNCVTLWNTVYLDAALTQLRAEGFPVRDEDVEHLSAYQWRHINVVGHYNFILLDLAERRRRLRNPDMTSGDGPG